MDKKSDHYTSAEVYRDLDGNHRQFTFIDHDVKSKYTAPPLSEEELTALKVTNQNDINKQIDVILALPAISLIKSGNIFAEEYIERDSDSHLIKWRENMVRDALTINHNLRFTFLNTIWKSTVQPQYWFVDMPYEDIMAGKWKDLI
jgi:hypothetical protein